MPSVLESSYIKPTRPYSQNELNDMRTSFADRINLSNVVAKHKKCQHFYRVKKNGKKYNSISSNKEPGNCSICWKLNKVPDSLYDNATTLVNLYETMFSKPIDRLSYDSVDVETCYYKWLYEQH